MEDSPSAAAATAVEVVTIQLTVTASQGAPRVPLTIDVSITPTALRQQAAAATNIPIGLLKIIFRGRLIADNVTQSAVTEYKLEEGSVLHCMGKPTATTTSTTTNDATTVSSSTTTTASSASGASIVLPTVSVVHPPNATAGLLASASDTAAETDPLQAALNLMRTSNPPSVYQTAVTTLDKILSNVIEDPMEEKYRSLKVQNPAFQRRLGGVPGGDAAIQACGFTIRRGTVEEEEEEDDRYVMAACAEKWPALLTAQAAVAQAVTWANAAAMPLRAVPAVPYAGGSGTATVPSWDGGAGLAGWMPSLGGDGGMADSPEIRQQVAQLLSNPQHLQAILQVRFFAVYVYFVANLWIFFIFVI